MTRVAKFISVLLHPLLMPLYAVIVLLWTTPLAGVLSTNSMIVLTGAVFILTSFIPLLFVVFLRNIGVIDSLSVRVQKQRLLPLMFGACMCYVCYVFLSRIPNLPFFLDRIFFAQTVFLLILLIITRFWKISLHMAAIGGLLAIVLVYSFYSWLPLVVLFLAGLLGTSRLWLKAHNSMQVYAGFCLGVSFFLGFLCKRLFLL